MSDIKIELYQTLVQIGNVEFYIPQSSQRLYISGNGVISVCSFDPYEEHTRKAKEKFITYKYWHVTNYETDAQTVGKIKLPKGKIIANADELKFYIPSKARLYVPEECLEIVDYVEE